jgi:hypothetical protein
MLKTFGGVLLALLLSACLLGRDGDKSDNPFLGQWKDAEDETYAVRDSLYREQLIAYLIDRGYTFTDGVPDSIWSIPPAVYDSFNTTFSCTAPVCDSILTIQKEYLVFTADSSTYSRLWNGVLQFRNTKAYHFDADSLYSIPEIPWIDSFVVSASYRFSANGDTLRINEEGFAELYIRNADVLP